MKRVTQLMKSVVLAIAIFIFIAQGSPLVSAQQGVMMQYLLFL